MIPFQPHPEGVVLNIKVQPQASKNEVGAVFCRDDGTAYLLVRVTAPADNNAANQAVIKLLAKYWRLAPSQIRLMMGAKNRWKRLLIQGDQEMLRQKLQQLEK